MVYLIDNQWALAMITVMSGHLFRLIFLISSDCALVAYQPNNARFAWQQDGFFTDKAIMTSTSQLALPIPYWNSSYFISAVLRPSTKWISTLSPYISRSAFYRSLCSLCFSVHCPLGLDREEHRIMALLSGYFYFGDSGNAVLIFNRTTDSSAIFLQ